MIRIQTCRLCFSELLLCRIIAWIYFPDYFLYRTYCCTSLQESGQHVHPQSLQLASYNPKHRNDSRDFWRFHDIPVAAWLGNASGRDWPLIHLGFGNGSLHWLFMVLAFHGIYGRHRGSGLIKIDQDDETILLGSKPFVKILRVNVVAKDYASWSMPKMCRSHASSEL